MLVLWMTAETCLVSGYNTPYSGVTPWGEDALLRGSHNPPNASIRILMPSRGSGALEPGVPCGLGRLKAPGLCTWAGSCPRAAA